MTTPRAVLPPVELIAEILSAALDNEQGGYAVGDVSVPEQCLTVFIRGIQYQVTISDPIV